MPSLYTFTDYSSDWPLAFEREAAQLRLLLGAEVVAIHHFGSTSVPGLAAKPIIDVMPLVKDIARVETYTAQFQATGYTAWGEYGLPGRRYFTKDRADGYRTHNIHIYQHDNPEVIRHLALGAYLRAHPATCAEYAALKRAVFAQHSADILAYNAGKDAWIKRLEPVAVAWYQRQNA